MTEETKRSTLDLYPDPFAPLLAPTKNNFPGGIPDAIKYYEARAQKAREAAAMLVRGAGLAQQVCEHTEAAARELDKLTPQHLELLGLGDLEIPQLVDDALVDELTPMVPTFSAAALKYTERAELLEKTVAALRAAQ